MTTPRPVYLLAPEGSGPAFEDLVPGHRAERVGRAGDLRDRSPGLLLIAIGRVDSSEALAALEMTAEASSEGEWLTAFAVENEDGEPTAVPVSIGWPAAAAELSRWVAGAADADILELRHVLARVGRGRHDLNNPLTSALAETQLALMDVDDPEVRRGLEAVEQQLRRIRDLISALRVLRPPV